MEIPKVRPDLILMDFKMPVMNGIDIDIDEKIKDIDGLLLTLYESFVPRWEAFKERQPLKEVTQFGKEHLMI